VLRILPLGDSITYGDGGSNAGYRSTLAELLTALDEPFRFVGTTNENRGRLPLEQSFHEGHCGWVIRGGSTGREGLFEHVPRWLGPEGVRPDVILLMIGTNDIDLGHALHDAPHRLAELVSLLIDPRRGLAASARLLLAQLPPVLDAELDARVLAFNRAVAELGARLGAAGQHVEVVDMHGLLAPEDMTDTFHPNDAGYRKIAKAWFDALAL
jgi:acyl-CoA thioesterase-1